MLESCTASFNVIKRKMRRERTYESIRPTNGPDDSLPPRHSRPPSSSGRSPAPALNPGNFCTKLARIAPGHVSCVTVFLECEHVQHPVLLACSLGCRTGSRPSTWSWEWKERGAARLRSCGESDGCWVKDFAFVDDRADGVDGQPAAIWTGEDFGPEDGGCGRWVDESGRGYVLISVQKHTLYKY